MSTDNSHLFVCYPTKSQKNIENFEDVLQVPTLPVMVQIPTPQKYLPMMPAATMPLPTPGIIKDFPMISSMSLPLKTVSPLIAVPQGSPVPVASAPPKPVSLNIRQDNLSPMQQKILFNYNNINISDMNSNVINSLANEVIQILKLAATMDKSNIKVIMDKLVLNINNLPEGLTDSQKIEIYGVRKNTILIFQTNMQYLPEPPISDKPITNTDVVNNTGAYVAQVANTSVIQANDNLITKMRSNSFKGTFDSNGIPYSIELGGNFPNFNLSLSSGNNGFEMTCSPTNSSTLANGMHSNLSLNIGGNIVGIQCALNEKK